MQITFFLNESRHAKSDVIFQSRISSVLLFKSNSVYGEPTWLNFNAVRVSFPNELYSIRSTECIRSAITFCDMEHQNNYINIDLNKSTCCTLQLNCESSIILGFNTHYFSFTLIKAKLIWCVVFDHVAAFKKKKENKYKKYILLVLLWTSNQIRLILGLQVFFAIFTLQYLTTY